MAKKSSFASKIGFGFSLIIFIYICCIGIKNVFRYNKFNAEHKMLINELDQQKKLNDQYQKEMLALKDKSYLELIVKQKLFLVKPGEKMYKFIEDYDR